MFEDLIRDWPGKAVVIRYDHPSRTWMFIAMHATRNGASGGGTRMKVYPTPADGLRDAMRLSEAMSLKMAVAGAPHGGGEHAVFRPARRKLSPAPWLVPVTRAIVSYGPAAEPLRRTS